MFPLARQNRQRDVFTPENFHRIEQLVQLILNEAPMVAEDDFGRRYNLRGRRLLSGLTNLTITHETFDTLASCWADRNQALRWNSIFILPAWLKVWWQELGSGAELYLGAVRQEGQTVGIAPLLMKEGTASIVGSADVCDCLDFIVRPGMERDFFSALLNDLVNKGVKQLDLRLLRPDSTVLTSLIGMARNQGYEVNCQPEDVSVELDLPATWEEYLAMLTTKQRHEVKRKLRRLSEAGRVGYRLVKNCGAVPDAMNTFLRMFTESRRDKATFLTAQREAFFRSLARAMAEIELLELGILELDTVPVAMTMGFDYKDTMYLYNSAYAPQYKSLSVGLLSKVFCIQEKIRARRKRFDFLKGEEGYKHHLGGREVPLYRCQISLEWGTGASKCYQSI